MTWDKITLGEIALREGGSVDPKKHPDEVFELYSIPAFDAGAPDVVAGSAIGSSKKVVQPNDVMVSRIVPHIRRACVVGPARGLRQVASSEWIIFRDERFWPQYLRWMLVGDVFHSAFMRTVSGVGGSLLRARPAEVFKIEVPLPPLPEQRRIAAILDKADAVRRKRQHTLDLADQFLRSAFLDMFGDPVTNPKHWQIKKLEEVSELITDGEHQTPERTEEGVKLLSARNVRNGFVDLEGEVDHISRQEYEKLRRRVDPIKGDLLISCSGSIGRVAMLELDEQLALVRSVALVRLNSVKMTPQFGEFMLRTSYVQAHMRRGSKASSQANLFQGEIRKLPVLVPPIEVQEQFGTLASQWGICTGKRQLALSAAGTLLASLTQRAFRGEL